MNVRFGAIVLLVALVIGTAAGVLIAYRSRDDRAPDFTIPTTRNETFRLSDHRGKVVVLDMMATWCASCKIVEANLKQVRPEWNESQVLVISIGVGPDENMSDLRAYQEDHDLEWTMARDEDEVALKYNVWELGHVTIVDARGRIVYSEKGVVGADELRSNVAAALSGSARSVRVLHVGLWALAAIAGAAAFFSPCAVGLLPGYVAHALRSPGGEKPANAGRVLGLGVWAALGVLLVFFAVGGLALLFGPTLTRYVPYLQPLVGFLLIGFGVLLLVRPYSLFLQRLSAPLQRWAGRKESSGRGIGFFAYGIGYGAAAAGCTTPVLLSIFVTAAAYGPFVGTGVVIAYAGTAALFMVGLTLASATFREGLARHLVRASRAIETFAGLAIIGGGVFLIWFAARSGAFAAG